MTRTVRDFKNLFFQRTGYNPYESWDFPTRSDKHAGFYRKLNDLGARRMHELPPEQVSDIDATITLSVEEWSQLAGELDELLP